MTHQSFLCYSTSWGLPHKKSVGHVANDKSSVMCYVYLEPRGREPSNRVLQLVEEETACAAPAAPKQRNVKPSGAARAASGKASKDVLPTSSGDVARCPVDAVRLGPEDKGEAEATPMVEAGTIVFAGIGDGDPWLKKKSTLPATAEPKTSRLKPSVQKISAKETPSSIDISASKRKFQWPMQRRDSDKRYASDASDEPVSSTRDPMASAEAMSSTSEYLPSASKEEISRSPSGNEPTRPAADLEERISDFVVESDYGAPGTHRRPKVAVASGKKCTRIAPFQKQKCFLSTATAVESQRQQSLTRSRIRLAL